MKTKIAVGNKSLKKITNKTLKSVSQEMRWFSDQFPQLEGFSFGGAYGCTHSRFSNIGFQSDVSGRVLLRRLAERGASMNKHFYVEKFFECAVCHDLFDKKDGNFMPFPDGPDDFTPEFVCSECKHKVEEREWRID